MTYAYVNKIIDNSFVDGPGNRTSIFLQGCNYDCFYCHNPETLNICNNCGKCVSVCPTHALHIDNNNVFWNKNICCECDACIKECGNNSSPKITKMTPSDVISIIKNNMPFINGITVSGGECTLYRDFLLELSGLVHDLNLTIFIDTNGSYDFGKDLELFEITDGFLLDVKSWSSKEHTYLTSVDNINVLKNLKLMGDSKKLVEVRTVIVPEKLNNDTTVAMTSQAIASTVSKNTTIYKIIKYRPMGVRQEFSDVLKIPNEQYMQSLLDIAINNCVVNSIVV